MPFNVDLTAHLDAFGLARSGAVTVRTLDGDLVAMETFHLADAMTIGPACAELSVLAASLLRHLPEQLRMLSDA